MLLLFRRNELIALAVDIDDLYLVVFLQMLAQLGDIHVHRTGVEIVVINPDGFQGKVALQDLIGVTAEQGQKFILLRSEFGLLLTDTEQLLLGVEGELTDMIDG